MIFPTETSLVTFQISESQHIDIVIDAQNKINTYGYKTEELHIFDEVEVKYICDGKKIILAKDILRYIMETFLIILEQAFKNELPLDSFCSIGKMGFFYSKKMYMRSDLDEKDDVFSQYWVWFSLEYVQTWLYNVDDKIYFEISPTYPWLFSDPDEGELYISFDEYASNYKPILIVK